MTFDYFRVLKKFVGRQPKIVLYLTIVRDRNKNGASGMQEKRSKDLLKPAPVILSVLVSLLTGSLEVF